MDKKYALDAWFRLMRATGEEATLRRNTRVGTTVTPTDATVYVKSLRNPTRQSSEELAGQSTATRRRYLVLAEDIGSWPLPIKRGDQLVVGDRTMAVMIVDDVTRRFLGSQLAIEVEVTGA